MFTETKDGGAVCYNRHKIAARGKVSRCIRIGGDRRAGHCHARRIGKRQIPLICHALVVGQLKSYPAPDDYGIRSRRNQFPIDVGLSFLAKLVLDIAGAPKLTRKLTGISVSRHLPFLALEISKAYALWTVI